MSKHVVKIPVFVLILLLQAPANAQQCGNLAEQLCEYVSTAVTNWNERFGDAGVIESWRYTDTFEVESAAELIALTETGNLARVARVDSEGNIRLVPLPNDLKARMYQAELAHVGGFIADGNRIVHRVVLNWTTENENFNTTLLASDTTPFMFDRTLTSVVVEAGRAPRRGVGAGATIGSCG